MLSCAFWLSFTALPAVFPGTHLRHVCSRVSPVRHLAMSGFPRTLRADFWQVPEGSVPASSNGVNYSDFSAGQLSTARILQQSLDLNPRDSGCPLFLLFIYSYFLPEAHCDFNPLLIIFFFFFFSFMLCGIVGSTSLIRNWTWIPCSVSSWTALPPLGYHWYCILHWQRLLLNPVSTWWSFTSSKGCQADPCQEPKSITASNTQKTAHSPLLSLLATY